MVLKLLILLFKMRNMVIGNLGEVLLQDQKLIKTVVLSYLIVK